MGKDIAILDFDNAKVKQVTIAFIRTLRGPHTFECKKVTSKRSVKQNAFLWSCVYPAVATGLLEAWGERLTVDEVHEFLKGRFLRKPVVNRKTGEIRGYTRPSTAALDKEQFAEYLDNVIKFAGEELGVEVPSPDTELASPVGRARALPDTSARRPQSAAHHLGD